jgi:hypothetical protein
LQDVEWLARIPGIGGPPASLGGLILLESAFGKKFAAILIMINEEWIRRAKREKVLLSDKERMINVCTER